MYGLRFFVVLLATLFAFAYAEEVELYSDKYDYIDPKDILENDRLRNQYYHCFMDTGPCLTPDAVFFKEHFPESIVTKCKRCTEKQKENFNKTVVWYTENQPDEWNTLVEKFINDAKKQSPANK